MRASARIRPWTPRALRWPRLERVREVPIPLTDRAGLAHWTWSTPAPAAHLGSFCPVLRSNRRPSGCAVPAVAGGRSTESNHSASGAAFPPTASRLVPHGSARNSDTPRHCPPALLSPRRGSCSPAPGVSQLGQPATGLADDVLVSSALPETPCARSADQDHR